MLHSAVQATLYLRFTMYSMNLFPPFNLTRFVFPSLLCIIMVNQNVATIRNVLFKKVTDYPKNVSVMGTFNLRKAGCSIR